MFSEEHLKYKIVNTYMDKDIKQAIQMCVNYLNLKQGRVSDDFYLILLDMYQVDNNREKFENLSETYRKMRGTVIKIWENKETTKMVSRNNSLQFKGGIDHRKPECLKQIDEFYQSAKKRKFGRMDFNNLNILTSTPKGLTELLELLYDFKESDITIVLMGDNKITDLNHEMFNQVREKINYKFDEWQSRKDIDKNPDFKRVLELKNNIDELEELVYLLRLEMYQWKGYLKDFSELSYEYKNRYNKFPPDYKKKWEKSKMVDNLKDGITTIEYSEKMGLSNTQNEVFKFNVKEINQQNLHYLTEYLNSNKNLVIFLDFKEVDYFNPKACEELLLFIQNYRTDNSYDIYIKNANTMIKVLFESVGLKEYISFG